MARTPRHGPEEQDGAVVVEFALVFGLFVTLLWGIFTYGVVFAVQQTVTHAAGEAARATVGYDDPTEARTVATSIATEQLKWLGASGAPDATDVQFGDCTQPAGSDPFDGSPVDTGAASRCVFVTYAYPWGADPLIAPLLDVGTPDTIRGTATITWGGS